MPSRARPAAAAVHSQRALRQYPVEARKDSTRVAFKNAALFLLRDVERVDIAPGIVEVEAGLRVDTPHSPDHLGAEQNVFVVDNADEQIDTRLMVHARIEEHVIHYV